jgi:hypothetical protein
MMPTATLTYAFMTYNGATLPSLTQTVQIWGGKMVRKVFNHCIYQVPVPESIG